MTRNPLIHRRVMLTFIKNFDAFSAAIERVAFEDLLKVVKSGLATVPEERLYSAVMRWRPDTTGAGWSKRIVHRKFNYSASRFKDQWICP